MSATTIYQLGNVRYALWLARICDEMADDMSKERWWFLERLQPMRDYIGHYKTKAEAMRVAKADVPNHTTTS